MGQVLLPLLLQLLLFSSCDKRAATKVAVEQTETAARAKEAMQKSLGKKRLSAVAAFTKNPTFNSRGVSTRLLWRSNVG